MQPYGSDRLRKDGAERLVLSSRFDKGWTPRAPKTLTTAEFPGTAVLWADERYFEVVSATIAGDGVRYVLEPWRDQHVMRTTDRYDEASEIARDAERRAAIAREKNRRSTNVLAPLTGHLPASVQDALGHDLGVLPARLTIASAAGTYAIAFALVLFAVSRLIAQRPFPSIIVVLAGYLFIESSIRFFIAFSQGRPFGSLPGLIGYIIYYYTAADRTHAASPFAEPKGYSIRSSDAPEHVATTDAFLLREPLVTLLAPSDQARVAQRFPYDWRHRSTVIAAGILVFALLGVITSLHNRAVISLLAAAALAAEQIWRLAILRHRPAGSILGLAARPLVRKLL
jgi:hypothetical protein